MINIPLFSEPYLQMPRHLRNYAKAACSLPWSFQSERWSLQGFRPCHPLEYDEHSGRVEGKLNSGSLGSLLLRCIATSHISRLDIKLMKTVLAKTPDMIKALQDSSVYPDSLDSGMQLLRTVNPKSPLLSPLEILVYMEMALVRMNREDWSSYCRRFHKMFRIGRKIAWQASMTGVPVQTPCTGS